MTHSSLCIIFLSNILVSNLSNLSLCKVEVDGVHSSQYTPGPSTKAHPILAPTISVILGQSGCNMRQFLFIFLCFGQAVSNDNIIFPEMKSADLVLQRKPGWPRCTPLGPRSWCDPVNYPKETMTHHIRKNTSLNQMLESRSGRILIDDEYDYDEFSYKNICPINTEYVMPRAAMSKEGKFMFIVNQLIGSEEYFQVVRVSICSNPEEECGDGGLFSTVSTKCMQEYSDRKLVALSETGKELVVETFSFPSCCSCMIRDGFEL